MTFALAISASGRGYHCVLRDRDGALRDGGVAPHLTPAVARLCAGAGCTPHDVAEVRVDLGPGSYTGLRVAVTFARTLQTFGGVSVGTATSLELIALRAWLGERVSRDRIVRAVLDARRGRYHHAAIRLDDRVTLVSEPQAVETAKLITLLEPGEALLVEDRLVEAVRSAAAGCDVLSLGEDDRAGLAELLFHPLLAPREASAEQLEPLYLMGSYAE